MNNWSNQSLIKKFFPFFLVFRNCGSFQPDMRNKLDSKYQIYPTLSTAECSLICDENDEIAINASRKRRKTKHTNNTKCSGRESLDHPIRDLLVNSTACLKQTTISSQLQLQVLSLHLQSDLPAFVSRAMQLFSDNNQCLLESSSDSFFEEQRAFVDEAVSIYFSELMPSIPSSFADCRYDNTHNHENKAPSKSVSSSSCPLPNEQDDPQPFRWKS